MGFFKKDISEPVWMIAKSLDNLEEWDVFGADSYFKSEFVVTYYVPALLRYRAFETTQRS